MSSPATRACPSSSSAGEGSRIWDADGKEYLDLFPGWGVSGLGHCHPARRRGHHASRPASSSTSPNNFYSEPQGRLAKAISEHSFGGKCFFCNSGAEANEAAIKLARMAHARRQRYKIITMRELLPRPHARRHHRHGPAQVPGGLRAAAAGLHLRALQRPGGGRAAPSTKRPARVMLEPIQGEGGINVAERRVPQGPAQALRRQGDPPHLRRGPDRHAAARASGSATSTTA